MEIDDDISLFIDTSDMRICDLILNPVNPPIFWRLLLPYIDSDLITLGRLMQVSRVLYVYIIKQQFISKAVQFDNRCCSICRLKIGSCWCIVNNIPSCSCSNDTILQILDNLCAYNQINLYNPYYQYSGCIG